jgi:hypothetical protein
MSLIPNVHPKLFTGSAILVGYLLIDDTTANEQNALGNWLMLMAQVLCTNAYYKQVMDEREKQVSDVKDDPSEIEILEKMVKALNKEIEILKNSD